MTTQRNRTKIAVPSPKRASQASDVRPRTVELIWLVIPWNVRPGVTYLEGSGPRGSAGGSVGIWNWGAPAVKAAGGVATCGAAVHAAGVTTACGILAGTARTSLRAVERAGAWGREARLDARSEVPRLATTASSVRAHGAVCGGLEA